MAEKLLNQQGLETYNTALQAKIANTYATKEYVTSLIGTGNLKYSVVDSLPSSPEEGIIYLVPNGEEEENIYDEYIYVNSNWEYLGTNEADLSQYYTKDEIDSTTESINANISTIASDTQILTNWLNTQFESDVQAIIGTDLAQDIDTLTEMVNDLNNQVTSGSKYVYVDDEGNLIITKDGNLGKFVSHADRTSLYLGTTEVAYIKDNKLYVNSIKTNSIQIGSWLYEVTSTGTLNEKWIGDE